MIRRDNTLLPVSYLVQPKGDEKSENVMVRFRTVGDMSCTCPVESIAKNVGEIIAETAITRITERGATRMDDQTSDASMELRKKKDISKCRHGIKNFPTKQLLIQVINLGE